MKRVVIESPYAPIGSYSIEDNVTYARACVRDSILRGEAPIASHLLFTQPGILDDANPSQRSLGMKAGFAWGAVAELCAVYVDHGISRGMQAGIDRALKAGIDVVERRLSDAHRVTGEAAAFLDSHAAPEHDRGDGAVAGSLIESLRLAAPKHPRTGAPLLRLASGALDNCAIACAESEDDCQTCGGSCPDARTKSTLGGAASHLLPPLPNGCTCSREALEAFARAGATHEEAAVLIACRVHEPIFRRRAVPVR